MADFAESLKSFFAAIGNGIGAGCRGTWHALVDFAASPYRLLLVIFGLTLWKLGSDVGALAITTDAVIALCAIQCLIIAHQNKRETEEKSAPADDNEGALRSRVERVSPEN